MEITYDLIKPIIQNEDWNGNTVKVQFKASEHEVAKVGTATVEIASASGIGATVAKSAGRSALYRVFSSTLGPVIRKFIPGFGGAIASTAATTTAVHYSQKAASVGAKKVQEMAPSTKKKAVLEAFNMVNTSFKYDEATKAWRGIN